MALPLPAEDVACRHITLVWSMLCQKAFVITKSAGVKDYIPSGYEAPQVAAGDVEGWVGALRAMTDDRELRKRCEKLVYDFGYDHCLDKAAFKAESDFFQGRWAPVVKNNVV